MSAKTILTESGTNEMEIAEFTLFGQSFGINVLKIREFLPYDGIELTPLAGSHPSISGVIMLRNNAIPIVRLDSLLKLHDCQKYTPQVVMVTQFNNITTGFAVDGIRRIHRASWQDFQPVHPIVDHGSVIGVLNLDDNDVLILDLEHIMGRVFPGSIVQYKADKFSTADENPKRKQAKLIFAEDSALIRGKVKQIFNKSGFDNVQTFENGLQAMRYIESLIKECEATQKDVSDMVDMIISDIEMPQLDGLSLCKRVKKDLKLDVPVVLFSSMINEQMALKCDAVGADNYLAKPETGKLIGLIDDLLEELDLDAPARNP